MRAAMRQLQRSVLAAVFCLTATGGVLADEAPPKVIAEKFAKFDRDGDKQLSVNEYQATFAAANAAVALRDFDLVDRNADNQLSLTEYWALPAHPVGQKHAADHQGHEDGLGGQAAEGAGQRHRRPPVRADARRGDEPADRPLRARRGDAPAVDPP